MNSTLNNVHGFWSYCSGGKCVVCNTQWPQREITILEKYLNNKDYNLKYVTLEDGRVMPAGLNGIEFIEMSLKLYSEYRKLYQTDPMTECKKRGAL